jgi:hypothetical protein
MRQGIWIDEQMRGQGVTAQAVIRQALDLAILAAEKGRP